MLRHPRKRIAIGIAFAFCSIGLAIAQPPATPSADDKARTLFQAGKFEEALKELQAAAKADPRRPPARVTLSNLYFQARQGQAARLSLEQAAVEDPKHPAVFLLNANYAQAEGRMTDAMLSFQAAIRWSEEPRWDPDQRQRFTREARNGLASIFEVRQDWISAREQLTAILQDDPKNGPARMRLGSALFRLGKPDEAFAEFTLARQNDPLSELPEVRMGQLFSTQNNSEKAELWFKKAIANHPKEAATYRFYAGWLLDRGKLDGVEALIAEAEKLSPTARETIALQGLFARYRKDLATAERLFEDLLRRHPNNSFASWNLSLVLADSTDMVKVRRAVELAEGEVRKNPQISEGYAVLAWCLLKVQRLEDAEQAIARATQSGPVSRDAAYILAKIFAERGKTEQALSVLKTTEEASGAFVYAAEARKLRQELELKLPLKKE